MLYSTPEKIKHILSYFNITNINTSFHIPGFDIGLRNLENNLNFHVFSYYPMYNILTYGTKYGQNKYPTYLDKIYDLYDGAINQFSGLDGVNYREDETFIRFKSYKMKSYAEMYFGLYDNLTTMEDVDNIFQLCGVRNKPVKKFGDFIIDDDNNLRLQQYPYNPIDTNVDDCLFGEFQVYRINKFNYKFQYVIYVKNNRPILYWHNSFINKLVGRDDVNVDLLSVMCNWPNMLNDFNDISKYNSEYFFVHNFLTFVIFRNTNNGIERQTPNIFSKDFFKILNDNVGYNLYGYSGSNMLSELSYTFGVTHSSVNLIYRFIDYEVLKNLDIFGGIPDIVTNAEDYNDAIFNLTSSLSPVLFLVS